MSALCGAILLSGCGDGDAPTPPEGPSPTPPGPAAVTPTPTRTPTPTATPTPSPTEEAGDEAGNRVRVEVTLAVEDVLPPTLRVPAFLGLRFLITNESGAPRTVKLGSAVIARLGPGDEEFVEVDGLPPGAYTLDAGESGRATITSRRAEAEPQTGGAEAPSP